LANDEEIRENRNLAAQMAERARDYEYSANLISALLEKLSGLPGQPE
jgi:hypothetical protein